MQSTGQRNPSIEDRPQLLPIGFPPLAARTQDASPISADSFSEATEYGQVARNRMVSVIALDHAFQPRSHEHNRLMHLPAQFLLDGKEFGPQPLRRGAPPDHKVAPRVPATEVREPEEREGLRLPFSALLSIRRREAPELDQSRLLRMDLQSELRQPLLEVSQEPLGIRRC